MPIPPISSVKTLHLSIFGIIFLMAVTLAIQPVFGISGSALFMKSNSTARIYADYTFRVLSNETETLNPEIFTGMTGPLSQAKDITIVASPSSFTGNTNHTRVVFTITAKGDSKGVYSLSMFFCGLSPLVVGLNESEVDPATLKEFFTATYNCPMETALTPDLNIVGYSGMVSKDMTINPNNTINVTSTGRLEVFSPLKQYKSGIKAEDVNCNYGFQLVIKAEDDSPACVRPDTAQKLMERGWTREVATSNLDVDPSCNGAAILSPNYHAMMFPVLLMQPNSTSCVKLTYAVIRPYGVDENGMSWPRNEAMPLRISDLNYKGNTNQFAITQGKDYTNSFNIRAFPQTIDHENYPVGSNFTVTYLIRPLPNATGFYDQSIPMPLCFYYPLAVGYKADQVNSSDFSKGMSIMLNHSCFRGQDKLVGVEVKGMSYTEIKLS